MTSIFQSKKSYFSLIFIIMIGMFSSTGFAKPIKPGPTSLLKTHEPGEPWDRSVLTAAKTVSFNQIASGGTDATTISKITMSYFTSADCTGSTTGSPSQYTTPNGTSYTIILGAVFGLVATSAWNVGSAQLSIADMTTINSIAVTFKSTNSNTPQANFSEVSFACVPVTCTSGPGGSCTETGSGTLDFELKTTAAVGDPADGGIIACQNTGSGVNVFDLVIPATDISSAVAWSNDSNVTGATSITDGASNTAIIIANQGIGDYAAYNCDQYSAPGGYTTGWYLPSGSSSSSNGTQINCIYGNQASLPGFSAVPYWSSTENAVAETNAWRKQFSNGNMYSLGKGNTIAARCAKTYTP